MLLRIWFFLDTVHIQTLFWALAIIGTEVQIPMRVIASLGQHAEKVSQSRELSPPFFFFGFFFLLQLLTYYSHAAWRRRVDRPKKNLRFVRQVSPRPGSQTSNAAGLDELRC